MCTPKASSPTSVSYKPLVSFIKAQSMASNQACVISSWRKGESLSFMFHYHTKYGFVCVYLWGNGQSWGFVFFHQVLQKKKFFSNSRTMVILDVAYREMLLTWHNPLCDIDLASSVWAKVHVSQGLPFRIMNRRVLEQILQNRERVDK
jgi:hypothetical protein